jgi:protein-S-isoprenylcysteine O-methyltransferase Ste14
VVESESNESDKTRAWEPTNAEIIISSVSAIFFIAEIVVCFLLYYNFYAFDIFLYSGWILLLLGLVIMSIPRFELSKRGNIPRGKSWVNTTVVIDTGIYGIVRHPMYAGWIISILAMMVISQYWITILLGIIPLVVVIYYAYAEDRLNILKFGQIYTEYRESVPMMNFFLGLVRYRRRRKD